MPGVSYLCQINIISNFRLTAGTPIIACRDSVARLRARACQACAANTCLWVLHNSSMREPVRSTIFKGEQDTQGGSDLRRAAQSGSPAPRSRALAAQRPFPSWGGTTSSHLSVHVEVWDMATHPPPAPGASSGPSPANRHHLSFWIGVTARLPPGATPGRTGREPASSP